MMVGQSARGGLLKEPLLQVPIGFQRGCREEAADGQSSCIEVISFFQEDL